MVVTSCFAGSVEVSRDKELAQKQYLKYQVQIMPTIWNEMHKALDLPQPDPLWTDGVKAVL